MLYKFEKVVDGITRYIDAEIYTNMNDLQEVIARVVVGRMIENENGIKDTIRHNGIIRSLGIVDSEGMVDVDSLAADLKTAIQQKGKVEISIPMFGKMTFHPEDIDDIHRYIKGEEQYR